MKKLGIFIFIIMFIILLSSTVYAFSFANFLKFYFSITGRVIDINTEITKNLNVTKENFPLFLQSQKIIANLPQKTIISMKTYSFDFGNRKWEKSYIVTRGKVKEGKADDPDLEITINSNYLSELGRDFCYTIKKARNNGDLGFELKKNKVILLWKYKSMIKYKSCIFG